MATFQTRVQAGKVLGRQLARRLDLHDPVVYGLPRGGVVVANEVAEALNTPLDVVISRKIGAPGNPEYAIAAIDQDGNLTTPFAESPHSSSLLTKAIKRGAQLELAEARRRDRTYHARHGAIDPAGREVILVDDGIATGLTMDAAIRYMRRHGARRIIVAVPVASIEAIRSLQSLADKVFVLYAPSGFRAVSQHYDDFDQVNDSEVLRVLNAAE
ncbi:MAG: phosphoribosyltransferase [Thermoleophilia bacterium]|nr:phosphoribosyltransferase [Thermoleophilia bacterium]